MDNERVVFCAMVLSLLLQFNFNTCLELESITPNSTIQDGDLLVSGRRTFALGFFTPSNSTRRFVGIWYYKVSIQTVVWVANRDIPMNDTSGILSIDSRGNLVLHEKDGSLPIWSTNVSSVFPNSSTTAQLLDSGNLVLIEELSQRTLWQSFDHPTDTLLPLMKLGLDRHTGFNRFLTPWKSREDPALGNYSYRIDATGYPQLFLYDNQVRYWRSGSWTGQRWSGIPEMTPTYIFNVSFVNNPDEVAIMYSMVNASIISRLLVDETGLVQRSTWHGGDQRWVTFWSAPKEVCDNYGKCGKNSNCNPYNPGQFECTCLPGFEPKSPNDWYLRDGSGGCVRRQGASVCRGGEGFVKVKRVKIPDTSKAVANMSLSLKKCEQECLNDCSCMAYASADERMGGIGCLKWYGDLADTRTFLTVGQDLYVRVDAITLASFRKKTISKKALAAVISVSAALLLSGFFACCFNIKKRKAKGSDNPLIGDTTSTTYFDRSPSVTVTDLSDETRVNRDLPFFDLRTIAAATNHFSQQNKLGQGGFGTVYKGVMNNGVEVAVKRLSAHSGQGVEEFKNEVMLIARLQHRNLVRILGCCIEEDEKIIVYEYLSNKSLDSFLFDESKSSLLDWRRRFEITSGVARGLLYLHQDSRLRIIHRDLKASNVLLDTEMNPKIADFGMARMCGGDQIEGNTKRVVGTYGYMSPEYAMQGQFSVKSDVYSFGVLLLEIVSGKRNSSFYHKDPSSNLIGHVWEQWEEGNCTDIIDKTLGDSYAKDDVLRCVHIGLLCVQEHPSDRPNMSSVVFMLGNMGVALPSPKRPAFVSRGKYDSEDPSTSHGQSSVNDVTITVVVGR